MAAKKLVAKKVSRKTRVMAAPAPTQEAAQSAAGETKD
jgi:hypothetical protein